MPVLHHHRRAKSVDLFPAPNLQRSRAPSSSICPLFFSFAPNSRSPAYRLLSSLLCITFTTSTGLRATATPPNPTHKPASIRWLPFFPQIVHRPRTPSARSGHCDGVNRRGTRPGRSARPLLLNSLLSPPPHPSSSLPSPSSRCTAQRKSCVPHYAPLNPCLFVDTFHSFQPYLVPLLRRPCPTLRPFEKPVITPFKFTNSPSISG